MTRSAFGAPARWSSLVMTAVTTALALGIGAVATAQPSAQPAKPKAAERPAVAKGKGAKSRQIVLQKIQALKGANAIALEYVILSRTVDDQGNVREQPVNPAEHTFQIGDACRVEVTPKTDVYLYVVTEDPEGNRFVLFPPDGEKPVEAKANKPVRLPGEENQFGFEEPVGEEKLAVIATKQKAVNLKELLDLAFAEKAAAGRVNTAPAAKPRATFNDLEVIQKQLSAEDDAAKNQTRMADISLAPDEDDGSFFEAATSPGNPDVVVKIPLRSRARAGK